MEPAGSEWNDRAAWSMLALKGMKEKTAASQRTAAGRYIHFKTFWNPSIFVKIIR